MGTRAEDSFGEDLRPVLLIPSLLPRFALSFPPLQMGSFPVQGSGLMKATAVVLSIIGLLLAGCVHPPGPVLQKELGALKGQPVKAAFDRLGYPNSEGKIAGAKFYVWSTSNTSWMPNVSTTTGTGMVGGTPFNYSQTVIDGGTTVNLRCTIRIFYDKDEIITHFDFTGNSGGCAQYAHGLDPSYHF